MEPPPTIAHELKNRLAIIIGYSQLLVESLPPEDPRHADAVEVLEAARQAAELLARRPSSVG
jgi:signal transduction histidine kinase